MTDPTSIGPVPINEYLNYGALGLVCLLCVSAVVYMFRLLIKERDKYVADLKAQETAHRDEMKALVERFITTSSAQVKEYYNLAEKITAVLESLNRRLDRRGPR